MKAQFDKQVWFDVEFKDEMAEPARCLSMGHHHQDNGNAFADRYIRDTSHGIFRKMWLT